MYVYINLVLTIYSQDFVHGNLLHCLYSFVAIELTAFVPQTGQSGSIIDITGFFPPRQGDNSSVTGLLINGIPAEVLVIMSFRLTVRAGPNQIAINNPVVTVMSNYSSFPINSIFTYAAPTNITMVTPPRGQVGTNVVISGESLNVAGHDLSQVLLDGNQATVTFNNDTTIICSAQSGAPGNGSVVLNYTRSASGVTYNGPTIVRDDSWQQLADGVINRIIPRAASVNQTILACGERLLGGGNQIVNVSFNSSSATQFSSIPFTIADNMCINITLPLGLDGSFMITLTADTGAVIESIVTISISSITDVIPNDGQYGTRVNITGVELFGNVSSTTVMLAGVDATIEAVDTVSRSWIVARAGRPPMLSRPVLRENCSTEEECTIETNITSDCPTINCSTNFNATFLTESCLTTCFGQNVSSCFTSCNMDGILNETCFLMCENSTTITDNSTTCFNNCTMPCCVNSTTISCANDTTCENITVIEFFEGSFSGQVAIVTEELGLTFNLTNSTVSWTYNISGSIATVVPSFGQLGTRVALNGTNLFGYGTSLQELRVNGTIATNIFFQNSTYIEFGAPMIGSGLAVVGLVDIVLTSNSGAIVELIGGFEYRQAGMVTSLVPAVGQLGTYGMLLLLLYVLCLLLMQYI